MRKIPPIPGAAGQNSVSQFQAVAWELGCIVTEKNIKYGDAFDKSGDFLALLYPEGITPDKVHDALTLVRMFDKMMRIATAKDAFGEDPFSDIGGYAILAVARRQRENARKPSL